MKPKRVMDLRVDVSMAMVGSPQASPLVSPASSEEWNFAEEYGSALHARKMTIALQQEMKNMCAMNADVGMKEISPEEGIGRFYSKTSSKNLSLDAYIRRLMRYMSCSSSTYVVAFVYLHRILKYEPRLAISDCNSHRLYLTAIVLACKYMEDSVNSNRYYARLGGLSSVQEMNNLESEFLKQMKFDLAVSPDEYNTMESYLNGIADRPVPMESTSDGVPSP